MPWKECSVRDECVRFVARLLEGEKMAALCREFAISRKTGYKIFDRYKESGLEALTDRSRRPWRYGNQLPQQSRPPSSGGPRHSIEVADWHSRKLTLILSPALHRGSSQLLTYVSGLDRFYFWRRGGDSNPR